MNKFIKIIAGTAEGIKLQRAQNAAQSAQLAQQGLINDLHKEVQVQHATLTNILDIGPESGDSLRPVDRSFDAGRWVLEVQAVKLSLKRANEKLDIAVGTYNEWFGEVPAVTATT